jgi:hypothetical protein
MKKNCERTRRAFPRYLRGHVFQIERIRIERHLATCVICRSEFEGLRRAAETRRILKEIDISEGLVRRVKDGVVSLSKLKKVFYRPLWLAAIAVAAVGVYHYAVTPRQLDLEIEKIVQTEPATQSAVYPEGEKTEATVATMPVASTRPVKPVPAPVVTPLIVNITPDNENAAIRRINEILQKHRQLSGKKFSATVREVSGSLSVGELEIFFDRIEQVARVSFNRRRLESDRGTQPIPFKLRLQAAPKTVEKHQPSVTPARMPLPTQAPTGTAIPAAPAAGPTTSNVPATGPTTSTVE